MTCAEQGRQAAGSAASCCDAATTPPAVSSCVWIVDLHIAAARRWLRLDPPQVQEADRTLLQIREMAQEMMAIENRLAAGARPRGGPVSSV